jgi:hypothetical protein
MDYHKQIVFIKEIVFVETAMDFDSNQSSTFGRKIPKKT